MASAIIAFIERSGPGEWLWVERKTDSSFDWDPTCMAGLFTNVIIYNPPNMSIRYVVLFSFYGSGNWGSGRESHQTQARHTVSYCWRQILILYHVGSEDCSIGRTGVATLSLSFFNCIFLIIGPCLTEEDLAIIGFFYFLGSLVQCPGE